MLFSFRCLSFHLAGHHRCFSAGSQGLQSPANGQPAMYHAAAFEIDGRLQAVMLSIRQVWVSTGTGSARLCAGVSAVTCHVLQGGQVTVCPSVKEGHQVMALFQLPSLTNQYRSKADEYLSHLVGHEGKGSLLSALKAKGWASELSAGVGESGYDRNTAAYVFEVHMNLTQAGFDASPGALQRHSLSVRLLTAKLPVGALHCTYPMVDWSS